MKLLKTVSLVSFALLSSLGFSAHHSTGGHTVHCRATLVDKTAAEEAKHFSLGDISSPAVTSSHKFLKVYGYEQDRHSKSHGEKFLTHTSHKDLIDSCKLGLEHQLKHLMNVVPSEFANGADLLDAAKHELLDITMFVEIDGEHLEVSGK